MLTQIEQETNYKVWHVLYQATDVVQRLKKKELTRIGLSKQELAVLSWIAISERPVTDAILASWTQRDLPPVRKLIRRMKQKGLLEIDGILNKRYGAVISVTSKGEKAYSDSLKQECVHQALATLSDVEKDQLYTLLKKIVELSNI